jgi:hypothetical protein
LYRLLDGEAGGDCEDHAGHKLSDGSKHKPKATPIILSQALRVRARICRRDYPPPPVDEPQKLCLFI